MNITGTGYVFHYPHGFDDRSEYEMERRGYLSGGEVELADGSRYPVFFYDPVRLAQDVESGTASGDPCLWEPGLVVIPEVTPKRIEAALDRLMADGAFQFLRPLKSTYRNGVPAAV